MNKLSKLIISLVIIVSVLLGSTLYFISAKINPELIRKTAISSIESNIPGAKATIGHIDYSISSSVKVEILNVELIEKTSDKPLLKLKSLKVNIPILAILTSGGNLDISTDRPTIYVRKNGEKLNWVNVLAKNTTEVEKKDSTKVQVSPKKIEVPSFLKKSKLNFKLNQLKILLNLGENQESEVKISKVRVKNLSLSKSTAFEIASNVKFQLKENQFFSTNISIVGETRLGRFLEKNEISITSQVSVTDTAIDGLDVRIPNIKGKLSVSGNIERPKLKSDIQLDQVSSMQTTLELVSNNLNINKLNIEIIPSALVKLLSPQIQQNLKTVELEGVKLKVSGKAKLNLESMDINPSLNISTVKSIGFKISDNITSLTKVNGEIENKNINLTLNNDVFGGKAKLELKTRFDPLKIPSQLSSYKDINIDLNLSNMKVPRSYLQNLLWSKSSENNTEKEVQKADHLSEVQPSKVEFPPLLIKVRSSNLFIDKEEVSVSADISARENRVRSKNLNLKYGKGSILTEFETLIKDSANINNNFKIILKKIDVKAFNALFPPFINDIHGVYNGSVNGSVNLGKSLNYNVGVSLEGKNGEIKQLDLKKLLKPLIDKYAKGKADKLKEFSNKFENLQVDLQATDKAIKLKKFKMIGYQKSSIINASGNISMHDSSSYIIGDIMAESMTSELAKQTGLKSVPFKLKGSGFVLIPDIGYTSGKLATGAVKSAVKKESKKLEEKIKVEAQKKIKNLFKGFKL